MTVCVGNDDVSLYIGNDVQVRLTGLHNELGVGTPITDATVSVEILDSDEVRVGSIIVCTYDADYDHYAGTIDSSTDLTEGDTYTIIVSAATTDGLEGRWTSDRVARVRGFIS